MKEFVFRFRARERLHLIITQAYLSGRQGVVVVFLVVAVAKKTAYSSMIKAGHFHRTNHLYFMAARDMHSVLGYDIH